MQFDGTECDAGVPLAQRGAPTAGRATAAPAAFKKSERFIRSKVETIEPVALTRPMLEIFAQRIRVTSSRSNNPLRKGSFI